MQMFTNAMCEKTKHFVTLNFKSTPYSITLKAKNYGKDY